MKIREEGKLGIFTNLKQILSLLELWSITNDIIIKFIKKKYHLAFSENIDNILSQYD